MMFDLLFKWGWLVCKECWYVGKVCDYVVWGIGCYVECFRLEFFGLYQDFVKFVLLVS